MTTKTDHKATAKGVTEKHQEHQQGAGKDIDGPHITQNKPKLGEVPVGPNASMDDVGKGSIVEEAPVVHAADDSKRVVHQGDEVMVHGSALIDGETKMHGLVLKVNTDSSIAVRCQRSTGQTIDFSPVISEPGPAIWWSWPETEELDKPDHKA